MKSPIFILFTRSFWLLIASLGMIVGDQEALNALLELMPAEYAELVVKYAPILTILALVQQRMGASRPYSLNPKDK